MVRSILLLTLLVIFNVGQVMAQTSDGQFSVTCADGRQIVGIRISLQDLTVGGNYRLTLLGEPTFDPALAVIQSDGTVICSDNDNAPTGAQLGLPSTGRWQGTIFATQTTVTGRADTNADLIVGGFAGQAGQFALVIEGFTIDPAGETDAIYVDIPPSVAGEWFGVYMIGGNTLDPFVELATLNSDGIYSTTATCDNANTRDCPDLPSLTDNGIAFSEDQAIVGDGFDAGILITPAAGRLWYTFSGARGASTGPYGLFITGTAPGDAVNRQAVCNNVAARIVNASPAYNELYPPQNLLDGDPSTRWVTGASSSGQPAFVVIGLSDTVVVDSVRVNGFVNQRRANAIKTFNIAIPNGDRQTTIAASYEAAVRPGYQTYTIVPARVDEVGLVLNETQGGRLFEIVDVQVCAAD